MDSLYAPVRWTEGVLTGTMATSVAIMALAAIGLRMLSGHIRYRRGFWVIVGCFMLFMAPVMSAALLVALGSQQPPVAPVFANDPSPVPKSTQSAPYDPYAGASLPSQGIDGGDLLPAQH